MLVKTWEGQGFGKRSRIERKKDSDEECLEEEGGKTFKRKKFIT